MLPFYSNEHEKVLSIFEIWPYLKHMIEQDEDQINAGYLRRDIPGVQH